MESTQTQPELWHPILTPYRLSVLLTTIGLGCAKAYAVSQQSSLIATSIEWITGVVIFSIFFILDVYQSEPNTPHFKWLLTSDIVRISFRMLSLKQPRYRSDELRKPVHAHQYEHLDGFKFPPITGYRLLTSALVSGFGIIKAYFAYQNIAPATDAFDWSLGIIITTLLYILGLYENNPVNLLPYLFISNYSPVVHNLLRFSMHLIGVALCLIAIRFSWPFILSGYPPSSIPQRLLNFSAYLATIALFFCLLLSFFLVCFRFIRFCQRHSPLYAHILFHYLKWFWQNSISSRLPPFKIAGRVYRRGTGTLGWIIGSIFFAAYAFFMVNYFMEVLAHVDGGFNLVASTLPVAWTILALTLASTACLFISIAYFLELPPFEARNANN